MAERVEQIGNCRLLLGDCLDILPTLDPVDAVITDPPYGLGFPYNSYDDTEDNLGVLVGGFVPSALAMASRCVITPGVTNIEKYPKPKWIGAWTWETTSTYGALGINQWQPVLFYGDDLPGFGNVNGIIKSDRFHFSGGGIIPAHGALAKAHCCPKPPGVMLRFVQRFSAPNETILDPFMGSGTTGVACVKLGRKFIGIEIDEGYFEIACRRIREAYAQPDMFIESDRPKPVQEVLFDG